MFLGHPFHEMSDYQLFCALRTEEAGWFVVMMLRVDALRPGLDAPTLARLVDFEGRFWDRLAERAQESAELIAAYPRLEACVFASRLARHRATGYGLFSAFRAGETTPQGVARHLLEQLRTRVRNVEEARVVLGDESLRWLPLSGG